MACNLKTASHRVKRVKFRTWVVTVDHTECTFDLAEVKVILGSLGAIVLNGLRLNSGMGLCDRTGPRYFNIVYCSKP